jgi:hypothetical protein
VIEAELAASASVESPQQFCIEPSSTLTATFSGFWSDDTSASPNPESTLTLTVDGIPVALTDATATAGIAAGLLGGDAPSIVLAGTTSDGAAISLTVGIEPPLFGVGEIPLHATSIVGLFVNPAAVGVPGAGFALVSDGFVRIDEAGTTDGAPVSGIVEGRFYSTPP